MQKRCRACVLHTVYNMVASPFNAWETVGGKESVKAEQRKSCFWWCRAVRRYLPHIVQKVAAGPVVAEEAVSVDGTKWMLIQSSLH